MNIVSWLAGEEPNPISQFTHALKGSGHYGEYLVDYALTKDNLKGRLVTFKNLILPYKGRTTEIDVLMLHEKGIYVFESKNYSGWIFGSVDQRQWTQSLNQSTKNHFDNPINQNKGHVNALVEHLNLSKNVFHSFIVFSARCELKKVPNNTDDYVILKRPKLLKEVRRDLETRSVIFDDAKFDEIESQLGKLNDEQASKEEHIENVNKLVEGEICPSCGGELVKRQGKYGEFLGCSNYPKCHFTRNV